MDNHLKTARGLSNLLDNKFKVMGVKFGLDPILGLVPWVGDLVALALSLYLIWIAKNMGASKSAIAKMGFNVFVDFFIGAIPVIGDILDFFYKANKANLKILEEHALRVKSSRAN